MTIFEFIIYTGLYLVPIVFFIVAALLGVRIDQLGLIDTFENIFALPLDKQFLLICASALPSLLVWGQNSSAKRNGKTRWTLGDGLGRSVYRDPRYYSRHRQFKYPDIPKELRHKNTNHSLCFGKQNGKYICHKINNNFTPAHWLIIGGSGSGKSSSAIINTLLENRDKLVWAIDIKGELSELTAEYDSDHICIVNPNDKLRWGFDVLAELKHDNVTSQEITALMQQIAVTIVGISAREKDPFWKNSARSMFTSFLIYGFKKGYTEFIDIIDWILSKPIKATVDEVTSHSKTSSPEYRYAIQFKDMADETISGIFSELATHIAIFANDADLRWCLKTNPHRVTPRTLEDGKSVYLSIREDKLSVYNEFTRLCVNLTLHSLQTYHGDKPILFVIDELGRILASGKLESLLDTYKTGRSRKIILVAATQSIEGLSLNDSDTADLVSNNEYISILSAKSIKTMEMIQKWSGKYAERLVSYGGDGKRRRSNSSFQERNVVDINDLITLQHSEEVILISPWGYNRFKKSPYYKDKRLKILAEKIKTHNSNIKMLERRSNDEQDINRDL